MLKLENISYSFNSGKNFNFCLELQMNDSLAILGPSGAGKTTLLNLIAGFYRSKFGNMLFNNLNFTKYQPSERPVNMLFQDCNLFPHLNVVENVALGIKPSLNVSIDEINTIDMILNKVGLIDYRKTMPYNLSGGQKQRVAIARVIIRNKPILLLDEPFTFLDQPLKLEMLDIIKNLQIARGLIVIMVTHDYRDAARICNKTALVTNGSIKYICDTEKISEIIVEPDLKAYLL